MAANTKNLVSNSERTPKERKKIAQRGGIASGEARRERKQLKDMLLLILEGATEGRTKNEEICTSLVNEALSGNVKAFEVIRDTIGEKPTDKVVIDDISELRESYDKVSAAIKNKNKRE